MSRSLLPQVHPVQKRRLVRQTARRTAAVQGRPSRLEVPAGLRRQPPQLRHQGVQGEWMAMSHLCPSTIAWKVFRCCWIAVSVSNTVFPPNNSFETQQRNFPPHPHFPTPPLPPTPTSLLPLSPIAGASGIEWTSSPVAPDWFVRLSLQVVLGSCEADRLLLVPWWPHSATCQYADWSGRDAGETKHINNSAGSEQSTRPHLFSAGPPPSSYLFSICASLWSFRPLKCPECYYKL